jgi:fatty-acyl-CoA synthase
MPYGRWIADRLRQHRDREAVIAGDRSYTYDDLADRVSQLVQSLRSLGLEPGAGVGLLGLNSFDYLALLLAMPVAGLRYTPMQATGTPGDHVEIIGDGELSAVVVDVATAAATAARVEAELPDVRVLTLGPATVGTDLAQLADSFTAAPFIPEPNPEGIVILWYTGGTTGRAKGVVWHDNAVMSLGYMGVVGWELPRVPRLIIATPMSHGSFSAVLPTIELGGTLIILPRFDAEEFLDAVERHQANSTFVVPTAIYALLDSPTLDRRDLSTLEALVYGGAAISAERLKEALTRLGPILVQNYGQTETGNLTAMKRGEHDPADELRLTSCGRPHFGVDVRITDQDGNELPRGEIGEICTRTPGAMAGYWKRPEDEARTVIDGWIRTGDVGRHDDDGFLYILDRSKDMIVSGGYNVYPKVVEDALDEHPAVLQSAVFGVPHEKWGEAVTATVVLRPGQSATEAELQAWVRESKGSVMAPKSIEFRTELPLTPVGKIDKKALRDPYWEGQTRSVG